MLGVPPSWLVCTTRSWSARALPLSTASITGSGCVFTGISVISTPLSRRIDRVWPLFARNCGPRISLKPSVNRPILPYLFIMKQLFPIVRRGGASRRRLLRRQVPRISRLLLGPLRSVPLQPFPSRGTRDRDISSLAHPPDLTRTLLRNRLVKNLNKLQAVSNC